MDIFSFPNSPELEKKVYFHELCNEKCCSELQSTLITTLYLAFRACLFVEQRFPTMFWTFVLRVHIRKKPPLFFTRTEQTYCNFTLYFSRPTIFLEVALNYILSKINTCIEKKPSKIAFPQEQKKKNCENI